MILAIALALVVTADGAIATYIYDEGASLGARLCTVHVSVWRRSLDRICARHGLRAHAHSNWHRDGVNGLTIHPAVESGPPGTK